MILKNSVYSSWEGKAAGVPCAAPLEALGCHCCAFLHWKAETAHTDL